MNDRVLTITNNYVTNWGEVVEDFEGNGVLLIFNEDEVMKIE